MRDIPSFDCEPGCSACCGLVPFSDAEMKKASAARPLLTWERFDARSWVATAALQSFECPFLSHGRCSIYEIRPKVCQLFGAVDHPQMTCPKGCGPERKLTNSQSRRILDAASS